MAGNHSGFPQSLEIFDRLTDGVDQVDADFINILADTARQLQVALGSDPLNNFPVSSGYHSLSTIGAWLPYLFRMEFGEFKLSLPIQNTGSGTSLSDVNIDYTHPTRFSKMSTNSVPHICLVSFDDPQESSGITTRGVTMWSSISRAPYAHVNPTYYGSSGLPSGVSQHDIRGFTLRNNDTWGVEANYEQKDIQGRYWAFEPNYQA